VFVVSGTPAATRVSNARQRHSSRVPAGHAHLLTDLPLDQLLGTVRTSPDDRSSSTRGRHMNPAECCSRSTSLTRLARGFCAVYSPEIIPRLWHRRKVWSAIRGWRYKGRGDCLAGRPARAQEIPPVTERRCSTRASWPLGSPRTIPAGSVVLFRELRSGLDTAPSSARCGPRDTDTIVAGLLVQRARRQSKPAARQRSVTGHLQHERSYQDWNLETGSTSIRRSGAHWALPTTMSPTRGTGRCTPTMLTGCVRTRRPASMGRRRSSRTSTAWCTAMAAFAGS
jgi:hypothetical protein